jgi:hypothetical protein
MRFDAITFPVLSLSDEVFRISEEEILADLLYPEAPPREGGR